jgi:acetyltransferase-like isoleucine patch superfamily enzyme
MIRSGTRITDSKIGHGREILDNCVIVNSEVANDCTVGPMAHLRGDAKMQKGAKVGNFRRVEEDDAREGSKASHLTYLGDATIVRNTNIGAGTVTCNYDGKNKHETKIGDNVRIGSDTMLIAPVEVGDGAVTGAGSVVTKDVEPNDLVVGVPAKRVKKGRAESAPRKEYGEGECKIRVIKVGLHRPRRMIRFLAPALVIIMRRDSKRCEQGPGVRRAKYLLLSANFCLHGVYDGGRGDHQYRPVPSRRGQEESGPDRKGFGHRWCSVMGHRGYLPPCHDGAMNRLRRAFEQIE